MSLSVAFVLVTILLLASGLGRRRGDVAWAGVLGVLGLLVLGLILYLLLRGG